MKFIKSKKIGKFILPLFIIFLVILPTTQHTPQDSIADLTSYTRVGSEIPKINEFFKSDVEIIAPNFDSDKLELIYYEPLDFSVQTNERLSPIANAFSIVSQDKFKELKQLGELDEVLIDFKNEELFVFDFQEENLKSAAIYDNFPIGPSEDQDILTRFSSTMRFDSNYFNTVEGKPLVNYPNVFQIFENNNNKYLNIETLSKVQIGKINVVGKQTIEPNIIRKHIKNGFGSLGLMDSIDNFGDKIRYINNDYENLIETIDCSEYTLSISVLKSNEDYLLAPSILMNCYIISSDEDINNLNFQSVLEIMSLE